jgi:hypothetical protein
MRSPSGRASRPAVPYAVLFCAAFPTPLPSERQRGRVVVLAVAHGKRRPLYGLARATAEEP